MTHGFFNKTCYKSEDLLSTQCLYEGDSLETTQASFVTFHPADCHMRAPGDTASHAISALLCLAESLCPFLCTQNAWRTKDTSPFSRMACGYENSCPGLRSVLSALLLTFFVAANSRIKAELFVLALVGERKNLGFVYVTSRSFLTVSSQSRTSPLVSCRAHFSRLILDAFCHRSRGNCFPNIPPTPFYQAIIEQKGELWKDIATRTPQICETLQLALFLCPKTLFVP